jgi:hypothetical protein
MLAPQFVVLLWPLFSIGLFEHQQDLEQWLPVNVGDRLIYETEVRTGDRRHPYVAKWQEMYTTVAARTITEGLWVQRKVDLLTGSLPSPFKETIF